jgi:hypothetical protein
LHARQKEFVFVSSKTIPFPILFLIYFPKKGNNKDGQILTKIVFLVLSFCGTKEIKQRTTTPTPARRVEIDITASRFY